jgi:hypothetical protein
MSSSALMTWRPKPLLALRHEVRSAAARTTCSSCGAERSGPRPWCGAPLGTVAGGHARRHPGPSASAAPLAGLGDSGGQEPASVIAGQLGHADRQRRPGPAGLHLPAVPDRFPGRRDARSASPACPGSEIGATPGPAAAPDGLPGDRVSAAQWRCGRDRIRTCVGDAGDLTGRSAMTSRVLSCPYTVPVVACDVHKRPVDRFGRHSVSPPVPARPVRPSVGRRESGGKSRRRLASSSVPTWSAGCTAVPMTALPLQAWGPPIGQSEPPTLGADRLAQLAGSFLTCQ